MLRLPSLRCYATWTFQHAFISCFIIYFVNKCKNLIFNFYGYFVVINMSYIYETPCVKKNASNKIANKMYEYQMLCFLIHFALTFFYCVEFVWHSLCLFSFAHELKHKKSVKIRFFFTFIAWQKSKHLTTTTIVSYLYFFCHEMLAQSKKKNRIRTKKKCWTVTLRVLKPNI